MLTALQQLGRGTPSCWPSGPVARTCWEGEVDEVEWQGGRVWLHLGARRR
jgi:hypothetical protein